MGMPRLLKKWKFLNHLQETADIIIDEFHMELWRAYISKE